MSDEKKKCYIYIRVSTSMQVEGYSLEAQRDRLTRFAEFEHMDIVREYCDAGKSGKNIAGRPEFTQMLQDVANERDGVSYILVFKLSRFGRNAADVLNSLQFIQDFGVNLICVEDGIDSFRDSGKLTITVLSAVAEIERENILVQTMEGRRQKAREGKWNGGQAPYGYRPDKENDTIRIEPEEAEVVRLIYSLYVNEGMGIAEICKYLSEHGYTKARLREREVGHFTKALIKNVIDNPVYVGKIAYGKIVTQKIKGTRDQYHRIKADNYLLADGRHEAIIDEDQYCNYRLSLNEDDVNRQVEELVLDMVNDSSFAAFIKESLEKKVDVSELEQERGQLRGQLRQLTGAKNKLSQSLDTLDISDRHYDRKYQDMQERLDNLYDKINDVEDSIADVNQKITAAYGEHMTAQQLYRLLEHFDKLYGKMTDLEKKEFFQNFIESIEIRPDRKANERILKQIRFRFPVYYNGASGDIIRLRAENADETVVLMSRIQD